MIKNKQMEVMIKKKLKKFKKIKNLKKMNKMIISMNIE